MRKCIRAALPRLEYMNHNQYFRFRSLAFEIVSWGGDTSPSAVDVGVSEGKLGSFRQLTIASQNPT